MIHSAKEFLDLNNQKDVDFARRGAFKNVLESIDIASYLPQQVFRGPWRAFLFFESDRIFTSSFADRIVNLISIENAKSCCLLNLSQTSNFKYDESDMICFEEGAVGNEYESKLKEGGPANGWLFSMDRYGCASDKGNWCIYCEKSNDVGVIAVRNQNLASKFDSALKRLHAQSIDSYMQEPSSAPFPFNRLTDEWRTILPKLYGRGS
jgi:hypothetical protein